MKPRINFARFRPFLRRGNGAKHRIPTPDDGKLSWGDLAIMTALILLLEPCNIFDYIPAPYGELLSDFAFLICAVIMLVGIYLYFHNLCPRSRWGRAMWSVGLLALTWSVLPFVLYWIGKHPDLGEMCRISLWSISMWVVWLVCVYKYWRVRVRSKQEIERIELRYRRQRRQRDYV